MVYGKSISGIPSKILSQCYPIYPRSKHFYIGDKDINKKDHIKADSTEKKKGFLVLLQVYVGGLKRSQCCVSGIILWSVLTRM